MICYILEVIYLAIRTMYKFHSARTERKRREESILLLYIKINSPMIFNAMKKVSMWYTNWKSCGNIKSKVFLNLRPQNMLPEILRVIIVREYQIQEIPKYLFNFIRENFFDHFLLMRIWLLHYPLYIIFFLLAYFRIFFVCYPQRIFLTW